MLRLNLFEYLLVVVALFIAAKALSKRKLSLPPGPPGYPIIGNLFDLPKITDRAWEFYANLGAQYGGIMSFKVLNRTIVVINDPEIVFAMFDKKGSIYSDRPRQTMFKLCRYDISIPIMPYNKMLREGRKLLFKVLGTTQALERFLPGEEYQSTMLLKRILAQSKHVDKAIAKTSGALVLQVTYGYTIQEDKSDPFVDAAEEVFHLFSEVVSPGRFYVDIFPFLQHLAPDWLPFEPSFKQYASRVRKVTDIVENDPFNFVKEGMKWGTNRPSYVSELLSAVDDGAADYEETITAIKWSAMSLYGAGTDTTKCVTLGYFLAVLAYPVVQQRLQAEIDRIIGKDRLPSLQDRKEHSLPYLDAVVKELFRWMPATPLALPHRSSADDVQNGYFIPKGSIIFANTWQFLHDPNTYKDPFQFNPERFLGPNPERSPYDFCFGYGRRICPGMKLAQISVWINIAKVAAALQINKAKDAHGNVIEPVVKQTEDFISSPVPFECQIELRNPGVVDFIERHLKASSST